MSGIDTPSEVQHAEDMNLFIDATDEVCEQTGTTWSERIKVLAMVAHYAAEQLDDVPSELNDDINELFELIPLLQTSERVGVKLTLRKTAAAEIVVRINEHFEKERII